MQACDGQLPTAADDAGDDAKALLPPPPTYSFPVQPAPFQSGNVSHLPPLPTLFAAIAVTPPRWPHVSTY